ncbi:hypothetical protein ATE84_3727 [Aquimarina sp. MAR_2010_214]|nr:hypothetical protein ATE84_3727 [Aquimarina sp. MAR_2010_214]
MCFLNIEIHIYYFYFFNIYSKEENIAHNINILIYIRFFYTKTKNI